MKDLGNILEEVGDALAGSLASRTRRNADAKRLIAPPPPGTPLLVSLALVLEHTGIYLGKNKVAELQDDGFVKEVTMTEFVNGDTGPIPLRNGTRIFAACDARSRQPVGKGITSIGLLERILARRLNEGHRIEWCPVARNRERFHCKLTEEKVARLKLEGKL